MTDYKPGDRVRVTFEATVDDVYDRHIGLIRDRSDGEDYEYLSTNGMNLEKLTPDYKAQIEALEPGTAFVLNRGGEITYFRTSAGVVNHRGTSYPVEYLLQLLGDVSNLRILK